MKRKTRKELIELLIQISKHRISHTDQCVWEDLNHGGECWCGVHDRWNKPGLNTRIKQAIEAENKWLKNI